MTDAYQKAILAAVAVLSFAWGIYEHVERKKATKANFKIDRYIEVSELASEIAVAMHQGLPASHYESQVIRLKTMSWGSLNLVASPEVERRVGMLLQVVEDRGPFVRTHSYCLARAMREEVAMAESSNLQPPEDHAPSCAALLP